MCIGTPVQVVESGEFSALCQGRNGRERVNTMLIGQQPEGTWLLNFLGFAREVISEQDAVHINKALDGIAAIMRGESDVDVDSYFPDMDVTRVKPTAGG
jgi:hydrogenase expression/formation protein HypC